MVDVNHEKGYTNSYKEFVLWLIKFVGNDQHEGEFLSLL